MDYIIAQYRLRAEGVDLVECGIAGFRPFEEHSDEAGRTAADMVVRFGERIDTDAFAGLRTIDEFEFEEAYADCRFCRYAQGYLFTMRQCASGEQVAFYKDDDSCEVHTDMVARRGCDVSLLRFGLWMMFGITIAPLGAIAIHSSVIVKHSAAVLCLGESGTGKSTHTRLWRENIEGARLLNDDSPIIRLVDGVPTAFGSPWSGKTPCYHNVSFPIRAFIRLSQAPHNRIVRQGVLDAIGALLPSCPPAFAYDERLQDHICDTLSQMIAGAAVYRLECLPDADAARLSYNTVFAAQA